MDLLKLVFIVFIETVLLAIFFSAGEIYNTFFRKEVERLIKEGKEQEVKNDKVVMSLLQLIWKSLLFLVFVFIGVTILFGVKYALITLGMAILPAIFVSHYYSYIILQMLAPKTVQEVAKDICEKRIQKIIEKTRKEV